MFRIGLCIFSLGILASAWLCHAPGTSLAVPLSSSAPLACAALVALALCLHRLWATSLANHWSRLPYRARWGSGAALVAVSVSAYYSRLLSGDMPLQGDHAVFVLRARMLGEGLWQQHSIHGFSSLMFAGVPAHQLYPVGVDLLVCGVRGASLGHLSWESAYCLVLLLSTVAYPLSLYALGARAGGIGGGLVSATLGLLERSTTLQPGYNFNVELGVVSMGLSGSCVLWGLAAFDDLLCASRIRRVNARNVGWLALIIGAALLFHPMALPLFAVALPLLWAARVVQKGPLPLLGWAPPSLLAAALGLGLAGIWFFPFYAHKEWYLSLALPWQPFGEVLAGLWLGNLMGLAPPLLYVGLFGLSIGSLSRGVHALFWAMVVAFSWYVTSDNGLLDLHLLELFPSLSQLQLERFSYLYRPGILIGCGVAFQRLRQAAAEWGVGRTLGETSWGVGLLAASAAPFVVYSVMLGRVPLGSFVVPAPEEAHQYASLEPRAKELDQVVNYLQSLPQREIGRVALDDRTQNHWLFLLPARTGFPALKLGFTPESNYIHKFETASAELWQALDVTHLVSAGVKITDPELRAQLTEVARFGDLAVYRSTGPRSPHARMVGPGRVQVERFENDAIDLRVEGAAPESQVLVEAGNYALWQAQSSGKALAVSPASIGNSPPLFMLVPARSGLTQLRYREGAVEHWANGLSLGSLALIGLLLLGNVRLRSWRLFRELHWRCRAQTTGLRLALARLSSRAGGPRAALLGPALGLLLVGMLAGFGRRSGDYPGRQVIERISPLSASVTAQEERASGGVPCERQPQLRGFRCPSGSWANVSEILGRFDAGLKPCITLTSLGEGGHLIRASQVALGEFLEGYAGLPGIPDRSQGTAQLEVSLDGQVLGRVPVQTDWQSFRFPTPHRTGTLGQLTFTSLPSAGNPRVCFAAASVR